MNRHTRTRQIGKRLLLLCAEEEEKPGQETQPQKGTLFCCHIFSSPYLYMSISPAAAGCLS